MTTYSEAIFLICERWRSRSRTEGTTWKMRA